MSSQQLDEERIFQIARQLAAAEARSTYLDQVCAGDQQLRERVEALLEAHEQESKFLKSSPDAAPTVDHSPLTEHPGTTIGRYKLMEQIGEGGMGTVFVAEQERPIRRKVALKVIKPGMDSKAVVARFEAERQALALMDHPNIAKVLDAGTTDSGRPYFVMELVRGIPITEYCDDHKLTIRERLELFTQVCQAIQHAHQKAIIHRDIKPTNVLVTEQDGKPVPKVIDFGVAKALNQRLTDSTIYTSFAQVVGTPLYMSPEQAALSAVDVDTRSDVYSLGVLLYELLTGTTPFDKQRFEQAAYDEIRRIVREEEPPKPSTKISTLGERRIAIAQQRRTDHERLGRTVRGDLDWIVMKALEKDRGRRYETAARLAADVRNHLNYQLVEARPPSTTYQLAKLYRRNRSASLAAALMVVLLLLGTVGTTTGWLRAKSNENDLRHERNAAVDLIKQNRELVIQRALLKAFEADVDGVDSIISEYTDVLGADSEWPSVLRAAAHWHAGRYKKAQNILGPLVLESSIETIPAIALLSSSYVYDGEWDRGLILANRLHHTEPRAEYADLDQLFLGYGLIFVDTRRAVDLLSDVLDRNPTWLICHAMLADALIHLGNFENNDRYIDLAFQKSRAVLALTDGNPFALNVTLFAHKTTAERLRLLGQDHSHLVDPAEELISKLAAYPDFILAHAMPAQFYDAVGDEAKAERAWATVLRRGGKLWRWAAIGRLYWNKSSEEMLELIEESFEGENDLWVLAAKACVLADIPGRRTEAMKLFEGITSKGTTFVDRYFAMHALLLLGEHKMAVAIADDWISEWDAGANKLTDTSSEFGEEDLIRIIATDGEWIPQGRDRLTSVMVNHVQGLLAVAKGDRESAELHFATSAKQPWVGIDPLWSEAFYRKIRKQGDWPVNCRN